jgi:uroporphyrinogen decarboxylase
VRYRTIDYGTGTYAETAYSPLAQMNSVEEIHAYRWPSADDFDYAPVTRMVGEDDGYRVIQAGGYEPFLLYCSLRGMEQAYEDLLVNPEMADAILGHIFDFHYEHNRRTFDAGKGKIDITYVAEDLGSQTGPLMGLETYRRFLREKQKKMADLAKSFGIHVFYHTDGAARVFIPDLIEYVGIEALNPIQWRCPTMDRQSLVRDFGKRIVFHGAIDNQQTLPFGTPDDVAAEVKDCVRIFRGARWICAPCHNLQPVTPTANIVAMYETIHAIGGL